MPVTLRSLVPNAPLYASIGLDRSKQPCLLPFPPGAPTLPEDP
jgi:hypothetical protein